MINALKSLMLYILIRYNDILCLFNYTLLFIYNGIKKVDFEYWILYEDGSNVGKLLKINIIQKYLKNQMKTYLYTYFLNAGTIKSNWSSKQLISPLNIVLKFLLSKSLLQF